MQVLAGSSSSVDKGISISILVDAVMIRVTRVVYYSHNKQCYYVEHVLLHWNG